jgi:hypothetical protein
VHWAKTSSEINGKEHHHHDHTRLQQVSQRNGNNTNDDYNKIKYNII